MRMFPGFHARRAVALAAFAAVCTTSAQATVTATGDFSTTPGVVLGPGDAVHPSGTAWIGISGVGNNGGVGSLAVDSGSFLSLARLSIGANSAGIGTGLVTGSGTRVLLLGDGVGLQNQRLLVGD